MQFNQLEIKDIKSEASDCVSIAFEIPSTLRNHYKFIPGQYLTLSTSINGEEIRRSYSICSFGELEPMRVAIKEVPGGIFSTFANQTLKIGDFLNVSTPEGNFTNVVNIKAENNYIAFVAGSGITPALSLIKSVLTKEPNSQFSLFYGNKNSKSIIFKEELENLKDQYLNRFSLFHILSQENMDAPLFEGRIDKDKCQAWIKAKLIEPELISKVFLCGPFEMIMGLKDCLPEFGIEKNKIKFELFFNPDTDSEKENIVEKTNPEETYIIKVTLDGKTTEIKTNSAASILDIAAEHGLDTPYSCKGGVCATCKAQITEGEIEMKINYALEEDEVENGFVLTCQSFCKTKDVCVNFDVY